MHCRGQRTSKSNARSRRECIAEARNQARALRGRAGNALQKPERRQVHCTVAPGMHCRSQRTSKSTAVAERECIAEAREQARALQSLSGNALQKPERRQEHCSRKPRTQCRSQKEGKSTARSHRECIAEARKKASALLSRAADALQKPENKQEHCSVEPGMHCRSQKSSKSTARSSRECIAEARKKASALHGRTGNALQKPENKQEHCSR